MTRRISLFSIIVLTLFLTPSAFATEHSPQDHGGADLILADGDVIWGLHSNIGTFSIPTSSTTVLVKAFDGSTTNGQGMVEIQAETINIQGVLDASAAGYTGGGGGGGGGGVSVVLGVTAYGGPGGAAPYGGGAFNGGDGGFGGYWTDPPPNNFGIGANGDGPWAGIAGINRNGGYYGQGGNDDDSYNTATLMGSGGAGWFGQQGGIPDGGNGGDAGGRGGGMIRLIATAALNLGPNALIRADGAFGQEGPTAVGINGASGGNVEPAIFALPLNFLGGGGAGGGILIDVRDAASVNVAPGANVQSLGAYNPDVGFSETAAAQGGEMQGTPAPANSGSIKLFYTGANPFTVATITGAYTPAIESSVDEWMAY